MHKEEVFTDSENTYSLFCQYFYTSTCEISKESGIQSSLSHIHWPIFGDEKKESVEIRCAYFINGRVALKSYPKRSRRTNFRV